MLYHILAVICTPSIISTSPFFGLVLVSNKLLFISAAHMTARIQYYYLYFLRRPIRPWHTTVNFCFVITTILYMENLSYGCYYSRFYQVFVHSLTTLVWVMGKYWGCISLSREFFSAMYRPISDTKIKQPFIMFKCKV